MLLPLVDVAGGPEESFGVVDTTTGKWYLRDPLNGETTSFFFGNPADTPFTGDWDCDGVDTPGLYRRSDGYVYLRNSNTSGAADLRFFFGNPNDVPLAGDFDGDGCDTVSIYRPSEQRIYVINRLGSNNGPLGPADYSFIFGNPGDKPFAGDFDGNGVDEVGLHRESTGRVYFRFSLTAGVADRDFIYGNPGDKIIAGVWAQKGEFGPDTVGIFRPSDGNVYLRFSNTQGVADATFAYGNSKMLPVAGLFGPLPGGDLPPSPEPHLVSRFTTYFNCCQPRVKNIQLMARQVNGAVVEPGEIFDLNAYLGPRTKAKGYVPAPILLNGEGYCCDHPLNIGGGTSQFGTTIYASIFWSPYDEISHKPHSRYIARYPLGIEATLGYPTPNVVFRNDSPTPVYIRTSSTSTSVTVELWGNNGGRTVVGSHRNGRTSVTVTNSGDSSARVVTGKVTGSATYSRGGYVTVVRTISGPDGTTSETWGVRYRGS